MVQLELCLRRAVLIEVNHRVTEVTDTSYRGEIEVRSLTRALLLGYKARAMFSTSRGHHGYWHHHHHSGGGPAIVLHALTNKN